MRLPCLVVLPCIVVLPCVLVSPCIVLSCFVLPCIRRLARVNLTGSSMVSGPPGGGNIHVRTRWRTQFFMLLTLGWPRKETRSTRPKRSIRRRSRMRGSRFGLRRSADS